MTSPVFYVEPSELSKVEVGSFIALTGEEGHHARNVKRLSSGESVDIADGEGMRAVGVVESVLPEGLSIRVIEMAHESRSPRLYLVQALAKGDRDIMAIEMATEVGVAGVIPWQADRSIVRWKGERAKKAHAKWQNVVSAAAKQSRRSLIPTVYDLHTSKQLTQTIAEVTGENAAVFILHEQGNQQLTSVLADTNLSSTEEIYVMVGPEGGISPEELDAFVQAGAQVTLLGQEVLRSSTAGLAALSAVNIAVKHW
ncbi:16S rRNA (uracil(1498)-N(3))-methyltransferase [Rothia terrae]|uniref:16S rRNA (uracil(1498)-N(3))-methyltransferase n=1 Tax=Rothia terrae TaxID=396015 RepID=UPI0037F2FE3F